MKITIDTQIQAPLALVWQAYTSPEDMLEWSALSDKWIITLSCVDLRVGGQFSSRMEAKDGSFGFNYEGIYTQILPHRLVEYRLGDCFTQVEFRDCGSSVQVKVTLDAQVSPSLEEQEAAWLEVLARFRRHVESKCGQRPSLKSA